MFCAVQMIEKRPYISESEIVQPMNLAHSHQIDKTPITQMAIILCVRASPRRSTMYYLAVVNDDDHHNHNHRIHRKKKKKEYKKGRGLRKHSEGKDPL